jgi:hypothetical protein
MWGPSSTKVPVQTTRRVHRLAAILLGGGERLNRETRFTRLSRIWTKHQRKVNRLKRIFGNSAVNIMRPIAATIRLLPYARFW